MITRPPDAAERFPDLSPQARSAILLLECSTRHERSVLCLESK